MSQGDVDKDKRVGKSNKLQNKDLFCCQCRKISAMTTHTQECVYI